MPRSNFGPHQQLASSLSLCFLFPTCFRPNALSAPDRRRLHFAMSKPELSFYVIHKPDDAFDRAWASAAATPTPPKPDEGLWTDRKLAVRAKNRVGR